MPTPAAEESPLLTRLAEQISRVDLDITGIVLLWRDDVPHTARALAHRFPHATIHILGARRELTAEEQDELPGSARYRYAKSQQDRIDYLMCIPRPQVIVDVGNKKRAHKLSSYRHLSYFVEPGGLYIVEELDACGDPRYDEGDGETVLDLLSEVARTKSMHAEGAQKARGFVRQLAESTGMVQFQGRAAVVERSGARQLFKLRDWEADETLTARYGNGWGEVIEERPAFEFTSRADVESHGTGPIHPGRAVFSVPTRYVRRYHDVTCTARQIVTYGDYALPDSWRHPHQRVLNNRQLVHSTPYFGRYLARTAPTSKVEAQGSYYYLDTELPGHFGHITTDVLSRAWAWRLVRELDPSVRPLVSVSSLPKQIPPFQRDIFSALGIPWDDALIVGPREAVQVETLYGPTPQLENPTYIDPDLAEIWRELRDHLPPGKPSDADKVFISRRPSDKRHCHETPEIEAFFSGEGFEIVFPEDHSYRDQKMIFERARIICGFGGSGMFNMMFSPRARVGLISATSYNAKNEHLIAAANGNELHYFWGESEIPMPSGRFSLEAFQSNFSFNLRRHRRDLRRISA